MATLPPSLDRYLRTLHRRLLAVRTLEMAGAGVLCASAAALLLLPILIARAQPALMAAGVILTIGAVAGAMWGWLGRPTRLDAAMEADRQLHLADLLSTALALSKQEAGTDPWHCAVLAMAEKRCAGGGSSSVLLARWGIRAWGAVGLAITLVVILALFSPSQQSLQADTSSLSAPTSLGLYPSTPEGGVLTPLMPSLVADSLKPIAPGSTDRQSIRIDTPDASVNADAASTVGRSAAPGAASGTGAGSAQTPAVPGATPPPTASTASGHNDPTGRLAAGAGRADPAADRGDVSSFDGASPGSLLFIPPWQSARWPAARQQAIDKINSGIIPDSCRDMVRDYFSRL